MKFVLFISILFFSNLKIQSQPRIISKEQLAIKLVLKIEALAGKALEKIKSRNVKAYYIDTTPVSLESLEWFNPLNKPKGFLAEYRETHNDELNRKIFDFKGVWIVTNLIHNTGIELGQMPVFYVKSEDMKSIFSNEEYHLIVLLSDYLFSTDLSINFLNESRIIDSKQELIYQRIIESKQEMIYHRIEKNIDEQVSHSLLDSFNLSLFSNKFLESIAKNSTTFRKSDVTEMTSFYCDPKLTIQLSSDELSLMELYPHYESDTIFYSPFDFQSAVSITLTDDAIGFGYHDGFTLYMNKSDFINKLPGRFKGYMKYLMF